VPPCIEIEGDDFRYHAATPIPADALGSYTLGVETRVNPAGTRYHAPNVVMPFAVTVEEAVPRRMVTSLEKCTSCHEVLQDFHGGGKRDPNYCVLCHNPTLNDTPLPAVGGSTVSETFNFKQLIHRVHAAAHYPDNLNNCAHCHLEDTTSLPLPATVARTEVETHICVDGDDAGTCIEVVVEESDEGPVSGACTSCHMAPATAAHAEVNTSPTTGVEACSTCHGSNRDYDVEEVHALEP
jgi:OmcA/MtrC family decaheme c-type cytochrome